ALEMLFKIPIKIGAVVMVVFVIFILFSNTYRKLEKWIMGFVSIIGFAFVYELYIADISWGEAVRGWVTPALPEGSILVVMSVLGAVVMPHNLFLHSEVIQSRQWNLEDDVVIRKQLKYEFYDTLFSMIVGWAINSAMIIMAAAVFFKNHTQVTELQQAGSILVPLLGKGASIVFAVALLLAGISSTITSGMAGGSIFAGLFGEPMDLKDNHSRLGVYISLFVALIIIFLITNPFKGLIYSQMILSIQLPFTIFIQLYLTSSKKVMGRYANSNFLVGVLLLIGGIVTFLNIKLLLSLF
ncbi:MAG: Nramp family divalent metal transporter, partial [Bacteroidales bacterium]